MKAVVILLFSMTSTFAQYRRSNPHEVVVDASDKYQQVPADPLVRTVIHRPEYEVEAHDTVVSSEIVCCVTKNDESYPAPISPTDQILKYPTENNRLEQNRRDVILRNLASIFRRVLSDTILKAIRSVLNSFAEPREVFKVDNEVVKANNYMPNGATNQLNYFEEPREVFKVDKEAVKANNYRPNGATNQLNYFEEPREVFKVDHEVVKTNNYMPSGATNQLKHFLRGLNSQPVLDVFGFEQPSFQTKQQKDYDCKIMAVGKCWTGK